MLALKINNPEIEKIFATKFNSNTDDFVAFISSSLKKLEQNNEFTFNKLDPKKNSYHMEIEGNNDNFSNPFEDIDDVLSFSKELRNNSYR